jgi:hypothetical protein
MENNELQKAAQHVKEAEAEIEAAIARHGQGSAEVKAAERNLEKALAELKEAERPHHKIHFTLDGEPEETEKHHLTPDEIIREFGGQDPATTYLVQIKDGKKIDYRGKGHEPIKLHDGDKFQIISVGPTPLSDGAIRTGVELFIEGLRNLGYEPAVLPKKPDHVYFPYEIQSGRFAGQKVRIGLIVPSDWKLTPPGGPHVSPQFHPIKSDGVHPSGHVYRDHSKPFEEGAGGEWQYWSRPFPGWDKSKKTVAAYMAHIFRLWDSQ